jgi:hypothetical protein
MMGCYGKGLMAVMGLGLLAPMATADGSAPGGSAPMATADASAPSGPGPMPAAVGPGPCGPDGKKPHCPPRTYCCLNILTPNLKRLWTVCHPPGPFTFTIDWLPRDYHALHYPCKAMDPLALDINNYLPPDWAATPPPPSPPLPSWPEGYVAPLPGRYLPTPAPCKAGVPIRFKGPYVVIEASQTESKSGSEAGAGKSGSEAGAGKDGSGSTEK